MLFSLVVENQILLGSILSDVWRPSKRIPRNSARYLINFINNYSCKYIFYDKT